MYREDLRKKDIILPYALWTELLKVTPVPATTATATISVTTNSSKNSNGSKRHEQDTELVILTELLSWLLYQPAPSSSIPTGNNISGISSTGNTSGTSSNSSTSSSELSLVEALESELGVDLSTMTMLYNGTIIR